jgi:hypothetical protein
LIAGETEPSHLLLYLKTVMKLVCAYKLALHKDTAANHS